MFKIESREALFLAASRSQLNFFLCVSSDGCLRRSKRYPHQRKCFFDKARSTKEKSQKDEI